MRWRRSATGKTPVHDLTAAETAAWKQALLPVQEEMKSRIGKDTVEAAQKKRRADEAKRRRRARSVGAVTGRDAVMLRVVRRRGDRRRGAIRGHCNRTSSPHVGRGAARRGSRHETKECVLKALRSALANQLLADPVARTQLRNFAEAAAGASREGVVDLTVVLRKKNGKTVLYQPVVVAKAA